MTPMLSLRKLAWTLGVPVGRLREIAVNVDVHYREWQLFDKHVKGKFRLIRSPSSELKSVQKRIKIHLFPSSELSTHAHGGIKNRSPKTNAQHHLAQKCVVTIDVRKFYPSIRHYIVYRMFRQTMGFGRDVSRLLTRLTTHNGELPQGSPASMAIANRLLTEAFDEPMSVSAVSHGHNFTRFVDDTALSGAEPRQFINEVARRLSAKRLAIHRLTKNGSLNQKLKIMKHSQLQEVTGVVVNGRHPSLSKRRRDRVRSAIHKFESLESPRERLTAAASIRGRIEYVRHYNPGSASRLHRYLQSAMARVEARSHKFT